MGHDVGRTLAAEDANGVKIRLRRDSGSDLERLLECRAVIGSRVGCAVGIHTEARGGARDVAAVSVAVERVRVRLGGRPGGIGVPLCVHCARVVVVADEVGAAFHLGRVRPEQRRICLLCAGGGCRLERGDGAGAAEVGVRVVDPGIDDRDLDAFAAQTRRALPHHRRANERHAHRVVRTMLQNRQDLDDARQRGERRDLVAIDFDLDSVQGMAEALEHAAAATRDFGFDALMLGRNLVFDRAPLIGGERAFRDACPRCRDGFGRHDDHDLDAAAALHAERNDGRHEGLLRLVLLEAARGIGPLRKSGRGPRKDRRQQQNRNPARRFRKRAGDRGIDSLSRVRIHVRFSPDCSSQEDGARSAASP